MSHRVRSAGLLVAILIVTACGSEEPVVLTIHRQDGSAVQGRVQRANRDGVTLVDADGQTVQVARRDVATLSAAEIELPPADAAPPPDEQPPGDQQRGRQAEEPPAPVIRDITLPAGTSIPVLLGTALTTSSAQPGEPVEATTASALVAEGFELAPAGATLAGTITEVTPPGVEDTPSRVSLSLNRLEVIGGPRPLRFEVTSFQGRLIEQQGNRVLGFMGRVVGRGPKRVGEELRLGSGYAFEVQLAEPLTVSVEVDARAPAARPPARGVRR